MDEREKLIHEKADEHGLDVTVEKMKTKATDDAEALQSSDPMHPPHVFNNDVEGSADAVIYHAYKRVGDDKYSCEAVYIEGVHDDERFEVAVDDLIRALTLEIQNT